MADSEKIDGRTPDADGYIPVVLPPDIMISLTRSDRFIKKLIVNSLYEPSGADSMFIEKKKYIKQVLFDDSVKGEDLINVLDTIKNGTPGTMIGPAAEQDQKIKIEPKELKLTEDDKQDKRRNIDGTGVHGESIRIGTAKRDPGVC